MLELGSYKVYFSDIDRFLLKSVARRAVAIFLSAAVLTGCANTSKQADVQPYLDEGTGATITGFARPMIFSHEVPMLAAFARDYVHVGPIEVNRQGNLDTMAVQVEVTEKVFSDEIKVLEKLTKRIQVEIKDLLGVTCAVKLVEPRTIQRSEGKAQRVIDNRKL